MSFILILKVFVLGQWSQTMKGVIEIKKNCVCALYALLKTSRCLDNLEVGGATLIRFIQFCSVYQISIIFKYLYFYHFPSVK